LNFALNFTQCNGSTGTGLQDSFDNRGGSDNKYMNNRIQDARQVCSTTPQATMNFKAPHTSNQLNT